MRLDGLAGSVYIVKGPLLAEKGEILRVEAEGLRSIWTGPEVPAEVVALAGGDLLVRLEGAESGRGKILLVRSEPGDKMVGKVLWEEEKN